MDSFHNQTYLFNQLNQGQQATLEIQRQHLEGLLHQAPLPTGSYRSAYAPSRVGSWLRQWGQGLIHWLIQDASPRISTYSQGGKDAWRVYDPMTQRTHYFDAETSLRAWLESRYYE